MKNSSWYVGCACDRNFVQHTAVMLTSLFLNGGVPEATILVAAFGLTWRDQVTLRAAAGNFGRDVRFVEVTRDQLGAVADREWEGHYSLPVFGRLFLPEVIDEPGARLLTLDSDMIVNHPVRPLFEMNMLGEYIAAIHDTPRVDDFEYFNSGMLVIDVDTYKKYDVTSRCLRWLSEQEQRPSWPDQDALNNVVGHKWFRLERTWNRAYCGNQFDPDPFTPAFYETANIAHFTGQTKPWNDAGHFGRPLYECYRAQLNHRRELYQSAADAADTTFLVNAFELFLGRAPSGLDELAPYRQLPAASAVRSILHSEEFAAGTLLSLKLDAPFPAGAFVGTPSLRHRSWPIERLPMRPAAAKAAACASSWRALLQVVLNDDFFTDAFDLRPMQALAGAISRQRELA